MKSILVLAVAAAAIAPAAFAQDGQQGSMRLLGTTAAAPPAEAPPAAPAPPAEAPAPVAVAAETPAPAAAPTPVVATGWTGPVNFAPVAVVDLVTRVCRQSVSGDGGDLQNRAVQLGLGGPQPPPDGIKRALPAGAVTWRVPSTDGELYLVGYGEAPLNCAVAVMRPMPEEGFNRVFTLLQAPDKGFASESGQTLPGDVRWSRLRSAKGEFVDVMEYPANGDTPGVLRADFLPG